jgi:hypothetical protein
MAETRDVNDVEEKEESSDDMEFISVANASEIRQKN